MTAAVTIYDISTYERRSVTQDDVDRMQGALIAMATRPQVQAPQGEAPTFDFRLAIYANPMRSDGVFIAQDAPIEPYDGARGLNGEALYPPVPNTPYALRSQVDRAFAEEIVRRWNAFALAEAKAE